MTPSEIDDLLLEHGLYVGNQAARKKLAITLSMCSAPEFERQVLDTLMRWAQAQKGLKDPNGYLASRFGDGSWAELYDDVRKVRFRSHAPEDSKQPDLEYATPDNPYGWPPGRRKQTHATNDHDRPGEWNAYRMCYNGPNGERRRTCTLYGHVGVELSPSGGPLNREPAPSPARKSVW